MHVCHWPPLLAAAPLPTQIGILLNNAGAFYEHPDYLETLGQEWIQEHLWINCLAPTMVRKLRRVRLAQSRVVPSYSL